MHLLLEVPLFLLIALYSYLEALIKLFLPAKRKSVTEEIVLITGAGHGLGRATAYEFAKHRSKLVLWDISKQGIEETAAECRKLGATAYPFVVDCSKREEIYHAAKKVKSEIGDVSILMNNAGVITTTDLTSTEDHQIQKIFEVNILAHYWTSKAFLPTMMANNHGHIITVASAVGHIVAPFIVPYWNSQNTWVIYFQSVLSIPRTEEEIAKNLRNRFLTRFSCPSSSKFAAVGLHRALTLELIALKKNGVQTSCVCPMFINSDFVKNPSSRLMPPLEPEQVAKQVMEGILTNQRMIFIPPFLKFSVMLDRLLPARATPALWKLNDLKFDVVVAYKDKEK